MAQRKWTGKWAGGRTAEGRKGQTVWILECMRDRKAYAITLRVHSESEAMAELALFERDPVAYAAAARKAPEGTGIGVPLGTTLILKFARDKKSEDGDTSPVTAKYLKWTIGCLKRWQGALRGADLRTLTLAEYRNALRTLPARRAHIVALRSFTKWARREGLLSSANDTSRDLAVPQSKARRAEKTVGYSMEAVEKLYSAIRARPVGQRGTAHHSREEMESAVRLRTEGVPYGEVAKRFGISEATLAIWIHKVRFPEPVREVDAQSVRDVIALRALCGMHHSEIERIASGARKVERVEGMGEIAGVVVFKHKKGLPHPQSLCAKALAAAERLQVKGHAPGKETMLRLVGEACRAAGLPTMNPGELRHSFVTWALAHGREVQPKGAGAPLDLVRRIVGHTSTKTTEIYNGSVPPMIALPLRLENAEDPVAAGRGVDSHTG